MFDSGSDDNFVQPRVAKFLHLDIIQTPVIYVLVGNVNTLKVEGLVKDISVMVQNHSLSFDAYVLPIKILSWEFLGLLVWVLT